MTYEVTSGECTSVNPLSHGRSYLSYLILSYLYIVYI